MGLIEAKAYLEDRGYGDRIMLFEANSATVELAAKAAGVAPELIAKSLTFKVEDSPVMIICAGDGKVDNHKYKGVFGKKATMLTREEVSALIGHEVGGVCPFGIKDGVRVYLDEGLKRFEYVYPACGNDASAVKLTPDELFVLSGALGWIDVCKVPEALYPDWSRQGRICPAGRQGKKLCA